MGHVTLNVPHLKLMHHPPQTFSFLHGLLSGMFLLSKYILFLVLFVIMATLFNRAGHYVFALWFLLLSFFFLLLFSSPNLSGCKVDVYHTSTHGVALV